MKIKSALFSASLAVLMTGLTIPPAFAQSSSKGNSSQSSASNNSHQNASNANSAQNESNSNSTQTSANSNSAQENNKLQTELSRAQALGTKSRAGIDQLGIHSVDINRALTLQADGDKALRYGNIVGAAEDYGRVQEAVSVLKRERAQAKDAQTKTEDNLHRAEQNGVNVSQAKEYERRGNEALNTGNFHNAETYYAQARAELNAIASK